MRENRLFLLILLNVAFLAAAVILYQALPLVPFLVSVVVLFLACLLVSLGFERGQKGEIRSGLADLGFRFRKSPARAELADIPHAGESGYAIRNLWLRQAGDVRVRIYDLVHARRANAEFRGAWFTCVLLDGARLRLGTFTLDLKHGPMTEALIAELGRRHATGKVGFVRTGIPFVDDHCRIHGQPDVERVFCPAMIDLLQSLAPLLIESSGHALLITTMRVGVGGIEVESALELARSSLKLAAAYGVRGA